MSYRIIETVKMYKLVLFWVHMSIVFGMRNDQIVSVLSSTFSELHFLVVLGSNTGIYMPKFFFH